MLATRTVVLRLGAVVALAALGALAQAGVSNGQCDSRDCGGGGGGGGSGSSGHLSWTPTSVDFGAVPVGAQAAAVSITFSNSGGVTTFSDASVIGANANDFAITSNTCTGGLGDGGSCTVQASYGPTVAGPESATLHVVSNADNSPSDIPLSGTGATHLAANPVVQGFGDEQVSTTSAPRTTTFTNDQQGNVTINDVALTGGDADQFALGATTCSAGTVLAPAASCSVDSTFTPTSAGGKSSSLVVTSTAANSPTAVALSGNGTPVTTSSSSGSGPALSLGAARADFGPHIVAGGPDALTITLRNSGNQPLIFGKLAITGPNAADFALGSNTCTTLAPGATCSITVSFMPGATGERGATLELNDNAFGSPQLLALTGSGLPPPVLFTTADVETVSGQVFVSLPPTAAARAAGAAPKGRTFIPLRQARQVPLGSIFDTRKGTVRVATATLQPNVTQAGTFFAGFFQLLQRRADRSLTDARLTGGSFACAASSPKIGKAAGRARIARKKKPRLSKKVIRQLQGDVHGKFRTTGRYAAATVRGTAWTMQDRCDGTLTRVKRGTVIVRNLRTAKQVTVRTGKSYLVRKP